MPASSAVKPRPRRGSRKQSARRGWLVSLWPLLLCLAVTPFAVRFASILALEGPKAFALLYPWIELARTPALHIPAALTVTLSQYLLYLQFPLYGLLMVPLARADQHNKALIVGLTTHFGALFTAVFLAWAAP